MNIYCTCNTITRRQVSNTTCSQCLVQFADQYLTLSTTLPGTESIYGLGEHKVPLQLKRLVAYYSSNCYVLCVCVMYVCACMRACVSTYCLCACVFSECIVHVCSLERLSSRSDHLSVRNMIMPMRKK